jgi:uncharacterized membrane protein YcgQ (UPF0703/DUF1980 family)
MAGNIITQERLKELLHYNPDTGIFTWKVNKPRVLMGSIAGTICNKYLTIKIDQVRYYSHRLAWLYMTGSFPDKTIDHINRSEGDNRFSNLRIASYSENSINKEIKKTNTSGYKGVSWDKNKNQWLVRCMANGKRIFLGYFDDIELAKESYINFAKKKHGKFYCDWPPCISRYVDKS